MAKKKKSKINDGRTGEWVRPSSLADRTIASRGETPALLTCLCGYKYGNLLSRCPNCGASHDQVASWEARD